MKLSKIAVITAFLLGVGTAGAQYYTPVYPTVENDPLVLSNKTAYTMPVIANDFQKQLAKRPYAKQKDGLELIVFNNRMAVQRNGTNFMPVKFYNCADNKLVSMDIKTNQIVVDGMLVEGSKEMRDSTFEAIGRLKKGDIEGYFIVLFNTTGIIENEATRSGEWYGGEMNRTIWLGIREYRCFSNKYLAAALVHEATHREKTLIHDAEEELCNKRQLIVLKKLGADYSEIAAVDTIIYYKTWREEYRQIFGKEMAEKILNSK